MGAAEEEQHGPVIEPDRVLATYQHVRERWGLKNADTARMKAKRAGWSHQPKNSPSDVTRLIVPREQWDAVGEQSWRTKSAVPEEHVQGNSAGISPRTSEVADLLKPLSDALATLREQLERERQRADAAEKEGQEQRNQVDQWAEEAAELRERFGRVDAERKQAEQRVRELEVERKRAERQAAQAQAELAAWTAGGPIARAVRALFYRR